MKTYGSFSEWKKDQRHKHKLIITPLEKLVEQTAPNLHKISKWSNGCWVNDNDIPLIYIHTEEDHIQFGFFGGALFKDPNKMLKGSGKFVRHIKLKSANEIDKKVFIQLIKESLVKKYR